MLSWRYSEEKRGKSSHNSDSSRRSIFLGCSLRKMNVKRYLLKIFGLLKCGQLLVEVSCDAYTVEMTFYPGECDLNTFLHHISQLTCHLNLLLATTILNGLNGENFPTHWSPSKSIDYSNSIPKLQLMSFVQVLNHLILCNLLLGSFSHDFSANFGQFSL